MHNNLLMKEVKVTMTVVEINTIIKALGQFPYNQVNELINKIHAQASSQLNLENGHDEKEKTNDPTLSN